MSKSTAVRLPDETYERLKALAERTGRTATYYIREAIEEHLDDLEDIYLAEQALVDIRNGRVEPVSAEEMSKRLGLDDFSIGTSRLSHASVAGTPLKAADTAAAPGAAAPPPSS
jgi:RHH-type rel operon transcriptional repressor/antitoxin RelB